ncbi:GNAT family N-acetyltransferase [Phenylobacterium sp.]|jgi:RimJ/RimL family protein N-acetyltransferase|uniref:GNAT family N-acetyltransferase n=1 Tax=Phenylobacterium sp. TaxID=1871053 RepID=UPI002E382198|nr:GNAT family N-acetyltransferase [Phenylobacterium sp.]HEX3366918.1 GNAT family N-acetyltransferase [Phenylobacterium sp.]
MILRRATAADALDVLAWRNDPQTRAMSRSHEPIDEAAHGVWFAKMLADPKVMLLIGETGAEKLGMVRFDHLEPTEVSININPAHRGHGHGHALLSQALAQVDGDVAALVQDDNLASRRLFERAGFVLQSRAGGLRRYIRTA